MKLLVDLTNTTWCVYIFTLMTTLGHLMSNGCHTLCRYSFEYGCGKEMVGGYVFSFAIENVEPPCLSNITANHGEENELIWRLQLIIIFVQLRTEWSCFKL